MKRSGEVDELFGACGSSLPARREPDADDGDAGSTALSAS